MSEGWAVGRRRQLVHLPQARGAVRCQSRAARLLTTGEFQEKAASHPALGFCAKAGYEGGSSDEFVKSDLVLLCLQALIWKLA